MLAQIPGADQAIDAAARNGNWVAILFVLMVLALISAAVFAGRWLLKRVDKQAERIDELHDLIIGLQTGVIEENTKASKAVVDAVSSWRKKLEEFSTGTQQTWKQMAAACAARHDELVERFGPNYETHVKAAWEAKQRGEGGD